MTANEPETQTQKINDTKNTKPITQDSLKILRTLRNSLSELNAMRQRQQQQDGNLDKVIFAVAGILALAFIAWGFLGTESLSNFSQTALDWVMKNTGWLFVTLAALFATYVIWLALSRFGNIPLGQDGEKPEFKTVSWLSMMFAAGMGIGLMFYGVAEPLYHFVAPLPGTVDPQSAEAISQALSTSLFHWSIFPWAMYAVVGIPIAYGAFRLGRSQLLSSVFTPLFGTKTVNGVGGKIINILAIFATLFGTAASLGLGALQIGSGLNAVGFIESTASTLILVAIVGVLTACFVASAVSGVARGIQWLSNINMVLAVILALVIFIGGPTLFILNVLPNTIGTFFSELPAMTARTEAIGGDSIRAWLSSWTIFYWAWWASWAPFVGMFLAKISRGRTIRQFVAGALLVPSIASVFWFSIFGGAGIHAQQEQATAEDPTSSFVTMVDGEVSMDFDAALFQLLDYLPMPGWLAMTVAITAIVLISIFFITGADSASIVMGSLSSNGNEAPKRGVVIFWGVLTGSIAAVMLLAGGDNPAEALSGLQRIVIVSALPFVLVMALMCLAMVKDVKRDPMTLSKQLAANVMEQSILDGVDTHTGTFTLVTQHACDDPDCDGDPCTQELEEGETTVPSENKGDSV